MRTALGALARSIAMVGIVGASLALGGVAAGATVSDGEAQPRSRTQLWLVVATDDGTVRTATLACDPAGGSHPDPRAACRDLAAADGEFADLPGDPTVPACIDIYDPVTVLAVGRWRGESVSYLDQYGNACELRAATGPVFRL